LWNHFETLMRAPIATETVLAHATSATMATIGPKTRRQPTGKMIRERRTGAMKIRTKVMKFSCSNSSLVRGNVDGNLIAPDAKRPEVVVRFKKNITTKLSVRYTANPTANRASGFPSSVSKADAAIARTANMMRIIDEKKMLILLCDFSALEIFSGFSFTRERFAGLASRND